MMKVVGIIFFVLMSTCALLGQSVGAEKASAIAPVEALEWQVDTRTGYRNALDYWKKQTEINRINDDAWLNYYKAQRAILLLADGAFPSKQHQKELDIIIGNMANAVPSGYAFQYSNYVNGNKSDESFNYLHQAHQLRPNDTNLWDDMLCDAVLSDDKERIKAWVKQINDARLFSWAELEYNRNTLNSVEANGILITNGNVDTNPLFMLQSEGFRTDVTIVCLDWLNSSRYIHILEAKLKVKPGLVRINDRVGSFHSVMNQSISRPVYVGLTVPVDLFSAYSKNLYCTGLALKHSESQINNIPSLVYNWEQLFQRKYANNEESITKNYLVPAQLLYQHYTQQGDGTKAEELRLFIVQKKSMKAEAYIQR